MSAPNYWEDASATPRAPSDVADVIFHIRCRGLPSDHAHALRAALYAALPWLDGANDAALIPVLGAASGNGWQRPAGEDSFIHLSRRAFFGLRVPRALAERARQLTGKRLEVCGETVSVTHSKVRPLSHHATLSARHLALPNVDDEAAFLSAAAAQLRALGVSAHKIMGGRRASVLTGQGRVPVRNLMVAELAPAESMRLQENGMGELTAWGCGVFLPHKNIAPVGQEQDSPDGHP